MGNDGGSPGTADSGALRAGARRLLDGLFPFHCVRCDLRSDRSFALCTECEHLLTFNRDGCERCALPARPAGGCPACLAGTLAAVDAVRAPLVYDAVVGDLVGRWKYRRDLGLTAVLASLWLRQRRSDPAPDLVVPVPLHWRRLCRRGFNQAERLATALVRDHDGLAPLQLRAGLLRRHRPTASQARLAQRARAGNLAGAFTTRAPCDNLRLALVDDVCTTGATANAAAVSLKAAGAARVELWCLARAPAPL